MDDSTAALAKAAGIPTVLVPQHPGVFSAIGLAMADIRHRATTPRRIDLRAHLKGPAQP